MWSRTHHVIPEHAGASIPIYRRDKCAADKFLFFFGGGSFIKSLTLSFNTRKCDYCIENHTAIIVHPSTMVTGRAYNKQPSTIVLSNGACNIAVPYQHTFPQNGAPKSTHQYELRDACCHLAIRQKSDVAFCWPPAVLLASYSEARS